MPTLRGLLSEPRKCQRGHAVLERQPGTWAIQQVNVIPAGVVLTETFFAASLYRCPVCGTLELVDEEQPNGTA